MLVAIVCGARSGAPAGVPLPYQWVHRALSGFDRDQYHPERLGHLITGGATGIDLMAHGWARAELMIQTVCPADWERHKKQAGPIRNALMLDVLIRLTSAGNRAVLAFPGGNGTEDMVARAVAMHVPTWRCSVVGRAGWRWNPIEKLVA